MIYPIKKKAVHREFKKLVLSISASVIMEEIQNYMLKNYRAGKKIEIGATSQNPCNFITGALTKPITILIKIMM